MNSSIKGKQRSRIRWALLVLAIIGTAIVVAATKYQSFYHHVTEQEVSHSVRHDTFEADLRGNHKITLQLYQQAGANNQELVLFSSGDGGWSPFCADIAGHLAANGRTVVGFDAKDYLTSFGSPQSPLDPKEITRDYGDLISIARNRPGVNQTTPVILSGWSVGAGYSLLAATQPDIGMRVSRLVAISLPLKNELAWKASDSLIYITHGTPNEKTFDSLDYVRKAQPIPFVVVNASDDDAAPLKDAKALIDASNSRKKLFVVKAWGHHFEGGEKDFYNQLDQAFDDKLSFE